MRLWIFTVIVLLVLLVGGICGYIQYSNSVSGYEASYEVSAVNTATVSSAVAHAVVSATVSTQTKPQTMMGHVENVVKPPLKFRGPTFTAGMPGLKIVATLSNSSVKVGETLWIKVRLIGEKACSVKLLRVIIMNSKGQKVYDVYTWLPHTTVALGTQGSQEEIYNIAWRASEHPSANVEVTPGNYTVIIKTTVDKKEIAVKGNIKVMG